MMVNLNSQFTTACVGNARCKLYLFLLWDERWTLLLKFWKLCLYIPKCSYSFYYFSMNL